MRWPLATLDDSSGPMLAYQGMGHGVAPVVRCIKFNQAPAKAGMRDRIFYVRRSNFWDSARAAGETDELPC